MTETGGTILERLAKLDSGQLSDVLDEAGVPNHALSHELAPTGPAFRMAGVAVCARGEPSVKVEGAERKPKASTALDQAIAPGSVLLIDAAGFTGGSVVGGLMAYSIQRNGCVGMVINGLIRDAAEIAGFDLPLYSRGVTPLNGSRRWTLLETQVPIAMPGANGLSVTVNPGDYVVADADGIVVVPAAVVQSIVEDSEELARIEIRIAEAMRAGGERGKAFKDNPRFAHVRSVI